MSTTEPESPDVSLPPREAGALRVWAAAHGVEPFLSMLAVGTPDSPIPHYMASGQQTALTFEDILTGSPRLLGSLGKLLQDAVAERLQAFARARRQALLELHTRAAYVPPNDPVLAGFFDWLRASLPFLDQAPRLLGRYCGSTVSLWRETRPYLVFKEEDLYAPTSRSTTYCCLQLMGWETALPRLTLWTDRRHTDVAPPRDVQLAATHAFLKFISDASASQARDLKDVLATPGWTYVLRELDEELDRSDLSAPQDTTPERIGFRLRTVGGRFTVEPVLQKRRKNGQGYSTGARLDWRELRVKSSSLDAHDLRVVRAYFDPMHFDPTMAPSNGDAAVFACLSAMADHPRCYVEGQGETPLVIENARLLVRFTEDAGGNLLPGFELGPLSLSPAQMMKAARDGRHVIAVSPVDPNHVVLAALNPATAAVVRAFAAAPVPISVEAKEDLLARLQPIQPLVDMELPASWIGEIKRQEPRLVVRLVPEQNGALGVEVYVRPMPNGPAWPVSQGPSVVMGGVFSQRHSVQRDFAEEEGLAAALEDKLKLNAFAIEGAHKFYLPAGDGVFDWLTELKQHSESLDVQWPRGGALQSGGSVGKGQLQLRVNTQREWFAVDGNARLQDGTDVRLAELLTAAREGRRYVLVQGNRFAKLEEELRTLLAAADGDLSVHQGAFKVGRTHVQSLIELVQHPEQMAADAAFEAFRRRLDESQEVVPRVGETLGAALRPYQWDGVRFLARLAHWNAGAVLADEMGLGKTLQALALLEHRAALGPAIVVCPTSVSANWLQEAARFSPDLKVISYREGAREKLLPGVGAGDVLVASYAIAALDVEALSTVPFATLVLDEAQSIKNAQTDRARAVRRLQADWKLALTGTPLENRLSELWSLFHTISPGLLGSWQRFRSVFGVPIERYNDAERRRRLAQVVRPYLLRRRKTDVAQELPPRTPMVRKVVLSAVEARHYETLRAATVDALSKKKRKERDEHPDVRMMLLAALTRLRQLACHPRLVHPDAGPSSAKLDELVRLALEFHDNGSRMLVFSQFRSFLDIAEPALNAAGLTTLRLDGTTPARLRGELVDKFQAGQGDAFFISLKAGGVGLNLTGADVVIHLDPWWNPAVEDQASDRATASVKPSPSRLCAWWRKTPLRKPCWPCMKTNEPCLKACLKARTWPVRCRSMIW
ncbi:MAG: DEAD/DEAH box helicase [Deltaproteobacteria bacterium]|nr:DEAD/DEAH box helicase [Deltaproteobacteria bacterium]